MKYIGLLRGINVGGKNKISMAELKTGLETLGFDDVKTYINSGNILLNSDKSAKVITKLIEEDIPKKFKLDSSLIKVLILSENQFKKIVSAAPKSFGSQPEKYHSDTVFLIDVSVADAMKDIETHPEVDKVWPGDGVIYYQRLSAKRTKSRLGKIIGKPVYKSMTIRSWNTVNKLLALL